VVLLPAAPASAHPLGNFSVNQYLGLTLHPDRVDATAVVDYAEIPTLQDRPAADTDHDGVVSPAELVARAATLCGEYASTVDGQVGSARLVFAVGASSFAYAPGAGGLEVSRLGCSLSAVADLATDTTLRIENRYLTDRVGWRELTALGDGVGLIDPPLPAQSVSNELRDYPQDLLSSVLDQRSATLTVTPGAGSGPSALGAALRGGDPISRWMSTVDRQFQDLAGGDLTPLVGLLAVLLAILLGAGHAALPGHGKTIMAAYLAGKRGRPQDALTVAGTVTLTHTAGVVILGVALTTGTALAGETILGWLGLVSGTVVLGVGAIMLIGVLRRRQAFGHGHHHHGPGGHHHHHGSPGTRVVPERSDRVLVGVGSEDHGHEHHHASSDEHVHDGALGGHRHSQTHSHEGGHTRTHHDHDHANANAHDHDHDHDRQPKGRWGRLGLTGIGIAGGLVPSPSALVVLLAAIGLGRTAFGILLVLAYGVGMAGTLAGAGLLLVAVQRRLAHASIPTHRSGLNGLARRASTVAALVNAVTPAATAALVLVVGAGLAYRAALSVL
jgi:ABC-type nickel/cobalt efflux system permease component RcnA